MTAKEFKNAKSSNKEKITNLLWFHQHHDS
jgi:hypothetical protein